jgi:hypothetical protein
MGGGDEASKHHHRTHFQNQACSSIEHIKRDVRKGVVVIDSQNVKAERAQEFVDAF